MTIPSCPLCNKPIDHFSCEHLIYRRHSNGHHTSYWIDYTNDGKTLVVEDAPILSAVLQPTVIGRTDTIILELNGFHILTMERVNKLLLLK